MPDTALVRRLCALFQARRWQEAQALMEVNAMADGLLPGDAQGVVPSLWVVARARLSLKARALAWLAQREHSRSELRRKLLRVARQEAAERAAAAAPGVPEPQRHEAGCVDPERCVDRLLDWLQAHRYLSEARFVESRVHARAARYGNLRIKQELAQHGVTPDESTLQQLRDSELERAREVWRRKFGGPAADANERARQMRFLAQRGFSAEVVRRVVQAGAED